MRWRKKSGERGHIMSRRFAMLGMAISIVLVPSLRAETVVLDFEELATPGTGVSIVGNTYIEDGFTVRAVVGASPGGNLYYWRSDDGNFPGSTALFADAAGAVANTQITRDDGRTFDLLSIMLSESRVDMGYVALTLNGTRGDNSEVSAFIELDGTFGFEPFSFGEFTWLKELRLDHDFDGFQYDQIVFDVVPEPGTLVLLALGAVIWPRRR